MVRPEGVALCIEGSKGFDELFTLGGELSTLERGFGDGRSVGFQLGEQFANLLDRACLLGGQRFDPMRCVREVRVELL